MTASILSFSESPRFDRVHAAIEERLERLQMAVAEWPDDYLEVALRIYGERHKGRIVLVTEQGRRRRFRGGPGRLSHAGRAGPRPLGAVQAVASMRGF